MTDLLLPDKALNALDKLLLRIITYMACVPFSNLMTETAYVAQLADIGYSSIEIEDISAEVFPGLARYIDSLSKDPRRTAALDPRKVASYRGFAKVLRWWSRGRLRFVLVKAMKGGVGKSGSVL